MQLAWDRTDFETWALKRLLPISLIVHLVIMLCNVSSWFHQQIPDEWVIEAELAAPLDTPPADKTSVQKAVIAEQFKVNANILPQLPKNVTTDEPEKKEDDPETFEEKELKAKEEAKKQEEEKTRKAKKEQEMLTLKKQEALERLIKEKARLEKNVAKETTTPLNETLVERKKELSSTLTGVNLNDPAVIRYQDELKTWIKRFYSLPQHYRIKGVTQKPVILLIIDGQGGLRQVNLSTSSSDASLDQLVLKTVQEAAPFPKPPTALVDHEIYLPFDL